MARPLSSSPWERLPEVSVTAHGPFAVGSVLWRDARGKLMCTVVAKATYELVRGESAPADVPLPIQEDDVHWDDEPTRSVHVPSDLAPFKSAAEVVVVGSAFAPGERPARSVVARVIVGSVDKAVECFPPRRFQLDGTVDDAAPLVRFSLRYEHAAGGPDNPAGLDVTRGDVRGRRPIPAILPPGFALGGPGDHVPVAGFGPIAAAWPARAAGLGPHDRAWILRPAASPLPQTLPARYFQSAPPDQCLDRPLAANERIVLEGLHAQHPRLVMSLSGLTPHALVGRDPLRLGGDLLFIDTDRKLCTLTFRGSVPVPDNAASLRVIVTGVPIGTELTAEAVQRLLDSAGDDDAGELPPEADDAVVQTSQLPSNWVFKRPPLPFPLQTQPVKPPGRPSIADAVLPFRGPAPSQSLEHQPIPQAPAPPPEPPAAVIAPPPIVVAPAPVAMPAAPIIAPVPIVRPEPLISPAPAVAIEPEKPAPAKPASFDGAFGGGAKDKSGKPFEAAFGGAKDKPAKPASFDAAFGGKPAARKAAPGFDNAFGGVKAASDAAADQDRPKEIAAAPAPASKPAGDEPRRLWVLDLLWADPKLGPRLRPMKRFASVWPGSAALRRSLQSADDPRSDAPNPDRDRADVLRVLSYCRPDDAAAVRRALAESLDEIVDLEPPVVLVAGELRPTFDEIETLRTTVAVAQPVAGTDKKLLAAIAVAQEALAAPIAPRPDATLGLARQIEQASGALSLPPRYVAAEVDRLLMEGRKYRRRPLAGEPRVRAELSLAGSSGESMIIYLPDTVATALPLMLAFPVVALCAVRPREDIVETAEEALFVSAVGRVLQARAPE